MQTLFDLIEEYKDDSEKLTSILIKLDIFLKSLHNKGLCILNFDPRKIYLKNGQLTIQSFSKVVSLIDTYENSKEINICQNAKIGLYAYNNMPIDGNMSQTHFELISNNLKVFRNEKIPDDIYEYYEEVFLNKKIGYLSDYLLKKYQVQGNQNNHAVRKTLSTPIGRALDNNESAYVKVLFIPSILTLTYLLCLCIYIFVLK